MKRKIIGLMMVTAFLVLAVESVAAAPVEKVDGFVCPVLGGKAGEKGKSSKIFEIFDGDYSVAGPNIRVPEHATNNGWPGGPHGSPGDLGYTAIWNLANFP